ncbi:D-alanine--D-alanine ligase [Candidatus Kaiserbacteria bacterium]|nr:D-alanine--D-alanine ligase [Candidatus Kaiserbacteria bacterium]
MDGIVVGVLRGGPSREHAVSLKTGAAMLAALPEEQYTARDIYIDTEGQWHDRGRPITPERALRQIDVALVALHGEYGEDGEVQKVLERFGIPYAGADALGSYLATHKLMSKARAEEAGLRTPAFRYVAAPAGSEEGAREAIRGFRQPVVVKPVGWGSSLGVSVVGGYAPVLAAVQKLFTDGAAGVLVEEYIDGREATVGIIENMRGEALYALPPVEIIPPEGNFFSYEAKYSGDTREICPGHFSRTAAEELVHAAKAMHRALGLRDYSRSDFIVAPRGGPLGAEGVYYLETNSLPGLTPQSLMTKALAAVGISLHDFLSHLVNLAVTR